MDELTEEDYEEIRRYVIDNAEDFPDLEDLPARMRRIEKILKPDGHPFVEAHKDALIQYYVDCSRTKLWAWVGLHRLLKETKGHEREPLWRWACYVVRDEAKPPPKSRGTKSEHNRNFRMEIVEQHLKGLGYGSLEEIRAKMSRALRYSAKGCLSESTIKSAIQRGRKARMR